MFRIGVTGPIASGKSTICEIMGRHRGVEVVNLDKLSKGMLNRGTLIYQEVVKMFHGKPRRILLSDGSIDRMTLAWVVFSSEKNREAMNKLCFPYLETLVDAAISKSTAGILMADAGVIHFAEWDDKFNEIWTTLTNTEVQYERIIAREYPHELASIMARLEIPEEERLKRADRAFFTAGSVEALEPKVLKQIPRLQEYLDKWAADNPQ
jgi:dephospho-CoA kinase